MPVPTIPSRMTAFSSDVGMPPQTSAFHRPHYHIAGENVGMETSIKQIHW
jgi:hypothetical protein